jgi:hypothetical protein
LTPHGEDQARALAARLRTIRFKKILTRPPLDFGAEVPVENAENYRVQRSQLADSSKFPVHSETAVIAVIIVRTFPLENHFINSVSSL